MGRLVGPKPKCVSAKKETALRLGGAKAVSEPYFPTRPSALLPTSPLGRCPLEAAWEQSPTSSVWLSQDSFLPLECSRSGPKG